MKVFNLVLDSGDEVTVALHRHYIKITGSGGFDDRKVFPLIEKQLSAEFAAAYPSDWNFIMVHEDYHMFLAMGSPQVMECGWVFTRVDDSDGATITIINVG